MKEIPQIKYTPNPNAGKVTTGPNGERIVQSIGAVETFWPDGRKDVTIIAPTAECVLEAKKPPMGEEAEPEEEA